MPIPRSILLPVLLLSSGCSESAPTFDPVASHAKMIARLDAISAESRENPYLGDASIRHYQKAVAELQPGIPMAQALEVYLELGKALMRQGREGEAVRTLEGARKMLTNAGGTSPGVDFTVGVAYLRLGETQNCCNRNNADSCVLPIRGGGVHVDKSASTKAVEMFRAALKVEPKKTKLYYRAIWLWNLAAMTLGTWPDALPEEYRVDPSAFRSEAAFPRFRNVAKDLGLNTYGLVGGAIADDFNGDDRLDLMVSEWLPEGPLHLFLNDGRGGFKDMAIAWGLSGIRGGINMVQADYDNDGDVDVLVLRGGWFGPAGLHPCSLLRNEGGRFYDVTYAAGLAVAQLPGQTADFGDFDNDGDLDLYLGHESGAGVDAPCFLFRNNGDGTFTDIAKTAGVTNDRFAKAVAFGDYDADRYPDIYVSNLGQPNRLYRNNRDGTFTDVAPQLGVTEPLGSFPVWFWDVDNDGHLDLFVSGYADSIAEVCATYLGHQVEFTAPRLYRGDGGKSFTDVAEDFGIARPCLPMGANFGDLDNDGFLDFYLGTGQPRIEELTPSLMFRNRGGRRFDDVTTAGGFGNLQKGHSVVFADFDADGDQDVFEQMGGAYLGDKYFDCYYQNPGFGNHWIELHLVGVRSNRSAIGAHIRLDIVESGKPRSIHRRVNSGGSFGANPLRQMIGIGKATKIEKVEVYWPTSDTRQVFADVAADRRLRLLEGAAQLTPIAPK